MTPRVNACVFACTGFVARRLSIKCEQGFAIRSEYTDGCRQKDFATVVVHYLNKQAGDIAGCLTCRCDRVKKWGRTKQWWLTFLLQSRSGFSHDCMVSLISTGKQVVQTSTAWQRKVDLPILAHTCPQFPLTNFALASKGIGYLSENLLPSRYSHLLENEAATNVVYICR